MNFRYQAYLPSSLSRKRTKTPTQQQETRTKSSIGQRQQVRQQRCSTQVSPGRTPSQTEIRKIECQQVTPKQLFISSQLRRSPSFRLKNYSRNEVPVKRQSFLGIMSENYVKQNRINALGDLLDRVDSEEKQSKCETKQTFTTTMATVPKQPNEECYLEELHFVAVRQQQSNRMLALMMEGRQI